MARRADTSLKTASQQVKTTPKHNHDFEIAWSNAPLLMRLESASRWQAPIKLEEVVRRH
jgi:hypothetical protein